MQKILVIQTAFIGDVVLATGVLEKLHQHYPHAEIDFLVRKGNESLFYGHPFLHEVLIWDKKAGKYKDLLRLARQIRAARYDRVINVQRFAATGALTAFSRAAETTGFDKNPFSFLFSDVIRHEVNSGDRILHEIERNHQLVESFTDNQPSPPRLYPTPSDVAAVQHLTDTPYICIAPASVWFTKQFPADQWSALADSLPAGYALYLLGAPSDHGLCEEVRLKTVHPGIQNLAGKLSFLQSAALMRKAVMNYVNDSAPMHFASAVNAPVCAVYCSTIPAFGFGPLSDNRHIVEVQEQLACRPCGLHGRPACPLGHFHCARWIRNEQLLAALPQ